MDFPIEECQDPTCPEQFHLNDWLWQGKCKASLEFRTEMVRAVESDLRTASRHDVCEGSLEAIAEPDDGGGATGWEFPDPAANKPPVAQE
jgi:hypothetical protein